MNIRSPVLAIAWEIWRKNRWGFLVVYGSLLCGLAARLLGPSEDEVPRFIAGAAMVISFLVTFTIFSYADSGAQIAFPARTFTLPVRTGMLINCPILFGALGITVLHFAWVFLLLLPSETRYPPELFTVYWIAALMTFQAIVWCLANYPKSFVIVLLLTMSLFVRLAVVLVEDNDASRAVVCLLAVLPVAYLGARVGIKRQRCGQWRILTGVQALTDKTTGALFRRKRPFTTAAQAQLWMEWRRNAVTSLISLGVGLALVCAGFVRFGSTDGLGVIAVAWFYLCCVLLTLWASISGLLLARDASSKSLCLSSFLATRPVTSGELAFAKIKLAGLMTLAGWLVYAAGLFLWFHFCWHPDQFVTRQDGGLIPAVGFVALALAWHLVGVLPVWITGRIESAVWAGLLLLGGYVAFGNALQFLDKHFGLLVALPWVFAFALIAKILIAVWSFREGHRRGLLSPRVTTKYSLFWLLGTICFISIAAALCRGSIFPQPLVSLTAGLLLPFARVGLAPLALARGRHR
jgi:hypothetical protein